MTNDLENKFVVNGFLVERTPSLPFRLFAPWSDKFSLPYMDSGELRCKPVVFYDRDAKEWTFRFNGVYRSEYPIGFSSIADAVNFLHYALSEKAT